MNSKTITKHNTTKTYYKPTSVQLDNSPKLFISPRVMNQINYFHNQIGEREWSGILFYTANGDITKPDKLELVAEYIYLKDVGTSASTNFDYDEGIFDFFDQYPDAEEMRMGLIHTHHTMNTYFSGTDLEELVDNAPNHNYYLSLICNFACKYSAKIAVDCQVNKKIKIKGEDGKYKRTINTIDSNEVISYDVDIYFQDIDDFTSSIVKDLKKPKVSTYTGKIYPGYQQDAFLDPFLDHRPVPTIVNYNDTNSIKLTEDEVKTILAAVYYHCPYPYGGIDEQVYDAIFTKDIEEASNPKARIHVDHMSKDFIAAIKNFTGHSDKATIADFLEKAIFILENNDEEFAETDFCKELLNNLQTKLDKLEVLINGK